MEELSKQQVSAIANKVQKVISEKLELAKKRAVHEYIPSLNYLKIKSKLDELDKLVTLHNKVYRDIEEHRNYIDSSLKKLGSSKSYYDGDVLNNIIELESNLPKVPTIQDIKDDIILDNMQMPFNVDKYIELKAESYIS